MPAPPDPHRLRVVPLHDRGGLADRLARDPASVSVRFNAIADLKRGAPAGYEAVFCIGDDGPALSPHAWSQQVHVQAAGAVEAQLVERVLAARAKLPDSTFLAVDVSAQALLGEQLPAVLEAAGRLERLVLVVADDTHKVPGHALRGVVEAVREAGGMIGVDETGSGYASLRQVLAVRPDFVRIGSDFVVEVDRDQAKGAVVETLASLASRIDAWVIACGIPGRPELAALRRMGVPLGQGPMFGVPAPEMGPLSELVADAIRGTDPPVGAEATVASLIEARPPLPWGATLDEIADAFLDDPRHDIVVLVDERSRPLALAERAALLRGEPYERPVMRITPSSPMKAVARRAAARPPLERFHPLVACDRRGVYLGLVRIEQLLDALAQ
jgi:EAL domain-containing protein (putative c-di-GMP-specific phosphodiesterase class I)